MDPWDMKEPSDYEIHMASWVPRGYCNRSSGSLMKIARAMALCLGNHLVVVIGSLNPSERSTEKKKIYGVK